ncbi:hypothetical protein [Tenacibaculum sp.]|uniref:hypothetical protein n=1 Tax=Tenacibaculum sp. TaxID=1906242 RepID=UPI003D09DFDD
MKIFQLKEEIAVVRVLFYKGIVKYLYTRVCRIGEVLELDKESLHITNSLEELKQVVMDQPVVLIFLGDEVLYSENEVLFKSSESKFYSTRYDSDKSEKRFLALIRKSVVDSLIDEFSNKQFFLLDIYIGGIIFNLLFKNNLSNEEELVGGILLKYEEGVCTHVEPSFEEVYLTDKLTVNEEILILSSVFNCFYPSNNIINVYEGEVLDENKEELKHKVEFNFISKISVIILLIVAILSYSVGKFFAFKNSEIEVQRSVEASKQRQLKELKQREQQQMGMLQLSGFYKTNILSFYVNELVKTLPEKVKLSGLEVFPHKKELKENKKIVINEKQILVEGSFEDMSDFNAWINKLKSVLSVEKINIVKYEKERDETNFEIQVLLK